MAALTAKDEDPLGAKAAKVHAPKEEGVRGAYFAYF